MEWMLLDDDNGCVYVFITTIFLCITKSLREQRHDITTQVLWRVILQLFNSIGGLRYYAITMRERAWMKVHKTFAMIAYQQAVSELETLAKRMINLNFLIGLRKLLI